MLGTSFFDVMAFPSPFPIRNALLHSLIWLLFILYEAGVAVYLGSSGQLAEFFLFFLVDLGLFYFHAHGLLYWTQARRQRYFFLPFLVVLELGLYLIGKTEGLRWLRSAPMPAFTEFGPWSVVATWRGIYILGLSTGYWFLLKAFQASRRHHRLLEAQYEMSLENNRLENAFLRSQINAHLVFNSLNFVYSKLQKVSRQGAELVLLLSDSMRFALREPSGDGMVSLRGEVEQIRRLIQIQRIRYGGRLWVHFHCTGLSSEGEEDQERIPPLLLVNLVENIFKHGQVQDPDHPAQIRLTLSQGLLCFHTYNRLRPHSLPGERLGLLNTKRRLERLMSGRGNIEYFTEDGAFSLTLKIVLENDLLCNRQ